MNFRMAINQADIPMIIQGAVNPSINQNQQSVVGGQTNPKTLPVRTLKIVGGIQISCGILLRILSIIECVLDVIAMTENCRENKYNYYHPYKYNDWFTKKMSIR